MDSASGSNKKQQPMATALTLESILGNLQRGWAQEQGSLNFLLGQKQATTTSTNSCNSNNSSNSSNNSSATSSTASNLFPKTTVAGSHPLAFGSGHSGNKKIETLCNQTKQVLAQWVSFERDIEDLTGLTMKDEILASIGKVVTHINSLEELKRKAEQVAKSKNQLLGDLQSRIGNAKPEELTMQQIEKALDVLKPEPHPLRQITNHVKERQEIDHRRRPDLLLAVTPRHEKRMLPTVSSPANAKRIKAAGFVMEDDWDVARTMALMGSFRHNFGQTDSGNGGASVHHHHHHHSMHNGGGASLYGGVNENESHNANVFDDYYEESSHFGLVKASIQKKLKKKPGPKKGRKASIDSTGSTGTTSSKKRAGGKSKFPRDPSEKRWGPDCNKCPNCLNKAWKKMCYERQKIRRQEMETTQQPIPPIQQAPTLSA